MPIFEYICRACDRRFDLIVQSSTVPECPDCQGRDLEKQLSRFAVGRSTPALPAGGPCAACPSAVNGGPCGVEH